MCLSTAKSSSKTREGRGVGEKVGSQVRESSGYCKATGKLLESFKQGTDMIRPTFLKDHSVRRITILRHMQNQGDQPGGSCKGLLK